MYSLDEYEGIVLQGMWENGAEIYEDIKAVWSLERQSCQSAEGANKFAGDRSMGWLSNSRVMFEAPE